MLYLVLMFVAGIINADFSVRDSISVLGGLDTNSMFQDGPSKTDSLVRVDPELGFLFDKNGFYTDIGGGFDYTKYFKNTAQSNFKWKFDSLIGVSPEESTKIELINNYDNNSDPVLMDTESRSKYGVYTLKINTSYVTKSKFWQVEGNFESYSKMYDLATFENFNNKKRYFVINNKFYFLPETAILFGGKGGYSFYTAGYNARPYGNSDSGYYYMFSGLEGRINREITMEMNFGFLYMDYEYGLKFHEPVVSLKLTDVMSPSHSISAIYERMAYDSTYTNYYIDNNMTLEFKSIFWDSIINLSTFEYIYRYYRMAPKRVDHILAFATEFSIPLFIMSNIGENLCFTTKFLAEWLNSDAYNSFGYYVGPDPAASYKRFVLLFGLTTKY
ncbi:MAG: hypothetical protein V1647_00720 [Pseudomonadota bacterium]